MMEMVKLMKILMKESMKPSEDNRYKVNEFGAYYQLNWKNK